MFFEGLYHVWYCSCADNEPERPDVTEEWYKRFNKKLNAISYAHDIIKELSERGAMIEYGIMEVGEFQKESLVSYMEKKRLWNGIEIKEDNEKRNSSCEP